MLIKCRPVKTTNSKDEIKESHIHIVTYGNVVQSINCHYKDGRIEMEEMIRWAHGLIDRLKARQIDCHRMNVLLEQDVDDSIFEEASEQNNKSAEAVKDYIATIKWPLIWDCSTVYDLSSYVAKEELDCMINSWEFPDEDMANEDWFKKASKDSTQIVFTGNLC